MKTYSKYFIMLLAITGMLASGPISRSYAGTVTVNGTGFSGLEATRVMFMIYSGNPTMAPDLVTPGEESLGFMAATIESDGSLESEYGDGPVVIVDPNNGFQPSDLPDGTYLIVAVQDSAPTINDIQRRTDIGDEDRVAAIPLNIAGDTVIAVNYADIEWINWSELNPVDTGVETDTVTDTETDTATGTKPGSNSDDDASGGCFLKMLIQ